MTTIPKAGLVTIKAITTSEPRRDAHSSPAPKSEAESKAASVALSAVPRGLPSASGALALYHLAL